MHLVRAAQLQSSINKEGDDEDAQELQDREEEFLSLDHIAEATNIDLEEPIGGARADHAAATALHATDLQRMPLSLLPLSDVGLGGSDILISTCVPEQRRQETALGKEVGMIAPAVLGLMWEGVPAGPRAT
jgi:hypothetical protein